MSAPSSNDRDRGVPADGRSGLPTGLPPGSRDLMPAAYRRRRKAIHMLVEVFERWGYGPVMTPLVEYYDVLGRGLTEADRRLCVRFIEAGSGELVTLRSDITPQIARMVAQRVGGELEAGPFVRRYCYAAGVIRQSMPGTSQGGDREQTESHQAGVELIGDGDAAADAELVVLCHEALRAVGLERFRIDLAHARIGHELIASLELPEPEAERVRTLLARKDREGVRQLAQRHGRRGPNADAAVALCDLFGPVGARGEAEPAGTRVLERARVALERCGLSGGLDRLEAVLSHVRALDPTVLERITVDLGEVRGFEYYTGLRVRVWAPGVARPIARGGRYDHLLERYGASAPATGFAIDLDALEAALRQAGSSDEANGAPAVHLVVVAPTDGETVRVEASRVARAQRGQGRRAWVVTATELEQAHAQADLAGADALTIVSGGQGPVLRTYSRTPDGWRELQSHDKPEQER